MSTEKHIIIILINLVVLSNAAGTNVKKKYFRVLLVKRRTLVCRI